MPWFYASHLWSYWKHKSGNCILYIQCRKLSLMVCASPRPHITMSQQFRLAPPAAHAIYAFCPYTCANVHKISGSTVTITGNTLGMFIIPLYHVKKGLGSWWESCYEPGPGLTRFHLVPGRLAISHWEKIPVSQDPGNMAAMTFHRDPAWTKFHAMDPAKNLAVNYILAKIPTRKKFLAKFK